MLCLVCLQPPIKTPTDSGFAHIFPSVPVAMPKAVEALRQAK